MRGKFIRHNNARSALNIDPLKRIFNSEEEFVDWLYKYVVPDYYGIPLGMKLWEKILEELKNNLVNIPRKLFYFIENEILPHIKIKGMADLQVLMFDYTYLLRKKWPFSSADAGDNNNIHIVKERVEESTFKRTKNPRKTLGIDPLEKTNFKSLDEFIGWIYRYLVPDFYKLPLGTELYELLKNKILKDRTVIPWDLYYYVCGWISQKEESGELFIGNKPSPGIRCTVLTKALREKFPFPDDNYALRRIEIMNGNYES